MEIQIEFNFTSYHFTIITFLNRLDTFVKVFICD